MLDLDAKMVLNLFETGRNIACSAKQRSYLVHRALPMVMFERDHDLNSCHKFDADHQLAKPPSNMSTCPLV